MTNNANARKYIDDSSSVELQVGDSAPINLRTYVFATDTNKNFTGTWHNDKIDASSTYLYKTIGKGRNRQTVEKEANDTGLTLRGGNGDDEIIGTDYSDKLYGDNGDDIITGGSGNDTITGGAGTNIINYTKGDGNDVINLTKGENFTLQLNGITDVSELKFEYANRNKDFRIYTDKNSIGEYITLKNFGYKDITNNSNARKHIDDSSSVELKIGDNASIDLRTYIYTTETNKNFTGTWHNDKIDASSATLYKIIGRDRNKQTVEKDYTDKGLTINGGGGDDIITGTKYSDKIYGGSGANTIIYTSGNDVIYLTKGETLTLDLSNVKIADILQGKNKKDLVLKIDEKNSVTLKNYYAKNTGATVYVKDITMTDYENFAKVPKFEKIGVNYFQPEGVKARFSYTGSALADNIDASEVYLTKIKGRGKNKTIVERETKETGLILRGDNGDDTIIGSKYSDTISGGNDDDTIMGGKGNDIITGGAGKNTINYTKGDGNDVINLTKGENFTLQLNGITDVSELKFEYANRNKDLRIYTDKNSTDEYITFKNFGYKDVTNNANPKKNIEDSSSVELKIGDNTYDLRSGIVYETTPQMTSFYYLYSTETNNNYTGTWHSEEIDASNAILYKKRGKGKNAEIVEKNATDIGLTLSGDDGDDIITGTKYSDIIYGGNGDDVIDGGAGNNILYGGSGDDIIYVGDGNNKIYGGKGDDIINTGNGKNSIYFSVGDGNDIIENNNGINILVFDKKTNWRAYQSGRYDLTIEYSNKEFNEDDEYVEYDSIFVENYKNNNTYILIGNKKTVPITSQIMYGDDNDNILINDNNNLDYIYGEAGNDTITNKGGVSYIYGDDGDDIITNEGTSYSINGDNGNDTITNIGAVDYIYGGNGNDTISTTKETQIYTGEWHKDTTVGTVDTVYLNNTEGTCTVYAQSETNNIYGSICDDKYYVYSDQTTNIVDKGGDNDILRFQNTSYSDDKDGVYSDLNIVFNVSKDFKISDSGIDYVKILDDENLELWKNNKEYKGVSIADNAIETIESSDFRKITSADINNIAQSVAGWLTSKDYADVNAVLDSGNQTDINALVAVFANNTNWTKA